MEASLSEIYSNMRDQFEERANSSDHSGDNSPSSTNFGTSISSPKRSRRTIQKRVVTTPLKDVEGPRFKGDCAPPSDSWAWRKYGQKPIKGSPYPRGYYRCSSSKGCPARKQVERSRSDPKMLVVTYSYEHNHPWPTSRNHHQNRHNPAATAAIKPSASSTTTATAAVSPCTVFTQHTPSIFTPIKVENKNHDYSNTNINIVSNNDQTMLFQHNHMNHYQEPLMGPTDELTWLSSDNSTFENNSFFSNCNFNDLDMSKIFSREEEESLFADLGELPECTVGFREAKVAETEEQQQCNLAPWCGTMG